jgi:hypothetical protein
MAPDKGAVLVDGLPVHRKCGVRDDPNVRILDSIFGNPVTDLIGERAVTRIAKHEGHRVTFRHVNGIRGWYCICGIEGARDSDAREHARLNALLPSTDA